MNELALFAGAGGGILGGVLLGWRTVCAVERDEYAASVLVQRQNDGHLEPFPVWSDVRTFDGKPWRGRVDVVSGGFPCQDISIAGTGKGIEGERSGLWGEMRRIICEVRPRFVFVENSPTLVGRGIGVVLGDLAKMGFDAAWGVFGAAEVGAPHQRDRLWVVASYPDRERLKKQRQPESEGQEQPQPERGSWWETEPRLGRVANGVDRRVDRLRAIGNGQVPAVAALAFRTLRARLEEGKP